MDRIKGLDPTIIGSPLPDALERLKADARWALGTYEPRVTVTGINVIPGDNPGDITVTAEFTEKE